MAEWPRGASELLRGRGFKPYGDDGTHWRKESSDPDDGYAGIIGMDGQRLDVAVDDVVNDVGYPAEMYGDTFSLHIAGILAAIQWVDDKLALAEKYGFPDEFVGVFEVIRPN
jgi:hypothetical protein